MSFGEFYSGVAGIGDAYDAGMKKSALGQLGNYLQNGDYSGAATTAFNAGDADTGLKILALKQLQDHNLLGSRAIDDINGIGSLYGTPRRPGATAPVADDSSSTTKGTKTSTADDGSSTYAGPITAASSDLDRTARTLVAEAGNQGPQGMAAVAAVIKNRASPSGSSPSAIVSAPGQFEGVGNGNAARVNPNSPAYQQALQIAQGIFTGSLPDPTNGATHFYAPVAQEKLGWAPPKWDDGSGVPIGDHVVFKRPGDFRRRTSHERQVG